MNFLLNLLCGANLILVLYLFIGHIFSPWPALLSSFSLAMISCQAILNVYFLKFSNNRLIKFYIFIFFIYFMQNLFFWLPVRGGVDLKGDWFGLAPLHILNFEKTFFFLTLGHFIVLSMMKLTLKNDDEFTMNNNFFVKLNYQRLNYLLVFGIIFLCLEMISTRAGFTYMNSYPVYLFRRFLLDQVWVYIIGLSYLLYGFKKNKSSIILTLLYVTCSIVISTMSGGRSGIIFLFFIFLLNLFIGNFKFKTKKIIFLVPFLIVFLLAQYNWGTLMRNNPRTRVEYPSVLSQVERFSNRLSGINYIHLFLNFKSPEKEIIIEKELRIEKRIKAGFNRFVGFKVYNEYPMSLLFEYFYLPSFTTITSALKVYGSEMPTWFGESYLYTKNFFGAFIVLIFSTLILAMIYNRIISSLGCLIFLYCFHNFFASFGFFDWYLPDTMASLVSACFLIWFLSSNDLRIRFNK